MQPNIPPEPVFVPTSPAEERLPEGEVPRVALLLPLSGRHAAVGHSLLNAAQLAVFDFSDEGFELLVHDTKGTAAGATQAAEMAIGEGASLILGPLLATSVRAVTPKAEALGINIIAFSNDRKVAKPGVFLMGFQPEAEIDNVVRFAFSRGMMRFAAMAPDNSYGNAVVESYRRTVATYGGTITNIRYYDPATSDFSAIVKQLANFDARHQALLAQKKQLAGKDDEISRRALERLERLQTIGELPFETLLLADGGKRLQALAAYLPYYDIDPAQIRMLGTGQWDVAGLGAEPALLGGWYAAPDPTLRVDFEARYEETFGEKSIRIATLAYDATALAAVLAIAEGGADFRTETLSAPEGYFGVDGIFRFKPSGAAERGLAVLQVDRTDARVIGKAPEVFEEPGS